jgi:hypothetical protein
MRLLQNSGLYPSYLRHLDALRDPDWSFERQLAVFYEDGYMASHILQPIIAGDQSAFFTNSDDEVLQRQWAREHGLAAHTPLSELLLAQLEEHRTEIFYNMDPMRYQSDFLRRLPGCVRKSVAWRAAPSPGADFSAYDAVMSNFPTILDKYRELGWRTAYFCPSHHPALDAFTDNTDRPVDVTFIGGFSRHHGRRANLLRSVAELDKDHKVVFHLDQSRLTRLAESIPGRLLLPSRYRRPGAVRRVSRPAVFGREMYAALARSKIVINCAIDMAGEDRGNLRCFEAMGCGSLLISDAGRYPDGMIDSTTMLVYRSADEALRCIRDSLRDYDRIHRIASAGAALMRQWYSKANQWTQFVAIMATV